MGRANAAPPTPPGTSSPWAGDEVSSRLGELRWAREHGCDWDESACAEAAKGGHLQVLQWLRANGCPWDESWDILGCFRGGRFRDLPG